MLKQKTDHENTKQAIQHTSKGNLEGMADSRKLIVEFSKKGSPQAEGFVKKYLGSLLWLRLPSERMKFIVLFLTARTPS